MNKAGKPTSPKKKAAAGLSAPETLSHATAWEAFRLDLQIRQNKYLYKRDIADFKNLETLQADRAKQSKMKSPLQVSKAGGVNLGDISAAIRSEELRLMAMEEERRYIAMQRDREELRYGAVGAVAPMSMMSEPSPMGDEGGGGAQAGAAPSSPFNARSPPKEIIPKAQRIENRDLEGSNVSLAWLSSARNMLLKERNSTRPIAVSVVSARELPVDVQNEPNQYGLVWTRQDATKSRGFVLLSNIETVTRNANALQFTVGTL